MSKACIAGLSMTGHDIVLALEERWYQVGANEAGNRQFVVADPDGYPIRPFTRSTSEPPDIITGCRRSNQGSRHGRQATSGSPMLDRRDTPP